MNNRETSGGFILLETMVALLVLGVLLVVCIQSIANILRASDSSYNVTKAAAYGQKLLAEGAVGLEETGNGSGVFGGGSSAFSWQLDTHAVGDALERYTYTLRWTERGVEKSLEFITAGTVAR